MTLQSPKHEAHNHSRLLTTQMGLNSPPTPQRNQTLPRRTPIKSLFHLPRLLSRRHSPPVSLAQNPSAPHGSPPPQRAPPLPPSTMATQISKKKKVRELLPTLSPSSRAPPHRWI